MGSNTKGLVWVSMGARRKKVNGYLLRRHDTQIPMETPKLPVLTNVQLSPYFDISCDIFIGDRLTAPKRVHPGQTQSGFVLAKKPPLRQISMFAPPSLTWKFFFGNQKCLCLKTPLAVPSSPNTYGVGRAKSCPVFSLIFDKNQVT